jgi:RluA family pseudouridine synthase
MREGRGGTVYTIGAAHEGLRLDRFLHDRIPRLSRTAIQRAIGERVRLERIEAPKASTRLQEGDRVVVGFPPVEEDVEALARLEIPILYEDDTFLAVDKPAGLVVHPSRRVQRASVIIHLRERHPDGKALTLVHRLDRGTSGVLLLAKGPDAARQVHGWFLEGRMRKRYLAIAAPAMSLPEGFTGRFDRPLGPDLSPGVRCRRRVDPEGVPAETGFTVLENHAGCSFLELQPRTGRQHQIRVHLQDAGHPVVGDVIYGPESQEQGDARHFLHAATLTVPYPSADDPLVIEAPLPQDMQGYLEAARESVEMKGSE